MAAQYPDKHEDELPYDNKLSAKEKAEQNSDIGLEQHIQELALDDKDFTLCSWNFDPGNTNGIFDKKKCLMLTLDRIVPTVVLLQEHVWVWNNIQTRITSAETDDLFSVVGHRWSVRGIDS
jgi:hypothetical protein